MATLDEVLSEAQRFAAKSRFDPETAGNLLYWSWRNWSRASDQSLTADRYVWVSRFVSRCGGEYEFPGSRSDVYRRMKKWEGADMRHVQDRRPNAEACHESAEEFERLVAVLTPKERQMVRLIREGIFQTRALALRMNLSPGRVSQMRGEIYEKWYRL